VVQRLHDRRLIVLVSGFVGRMFLLLVVIAPFFAHEKFAKNFPFFVNSLFYGNNLRVSLRNHSALSPNVGGLATLFFAASLWTWMSM
jgi:hypothetical protein